MHQILYCFILLYFVLGAIAFGLIGRRKDQAGRRSLWMKYFTFLLLVHLLYGSIVFFASHFIMVAALIGSMGLFELTRIWWLHGKKGNPWVFPAGLLVYLSFFACFILFSMMEQGSLLFVFVVVMVFDAFSQISGQLMGGRKLIPSVSPRKTLSGSVGGAILALVTALLIRPLIGASPSATLLIGGIILIFALLGALMASFYKRRFAVKDFGSTLPGHGGFLDRFDAFIAAGAAMYLLNQVIP